jgi:hypothetical protein
MRSAGVGAVQIRRSGKMTLVTNMVDRGESNVTARRRNS